MPAFLEYHQVRSVTAFCFYTGAGLSDSFFSLKRRYTLPLPFGTCYTFLSYNGRHADQPLLLLLDLPCTLTLCIRTANV